jgi:hypothetical protein
LISQKQQLLNLCKQFIEANRIECPETIYQCDWASENALEFIENICDIIGYYKYSDD